VLNVFAFLFDTFFMWRIKEIIGRIMYDVILF